MKSVAGNLRLSLAQFRELAAFAQFSTDLDPETKQRIERGQRLTELLKQPQYSPLSVWEQTALLLAANEGAFDAVPVTEVKVASAALLSELGKQHRKEMDTLNKGDKPDDKISKVIVDAAKRVAKQYEPKPEKAQTEKAEA